jgi:hypothetical protein
MLPDPHSISLEEVPHTVLFPRDEIDQIFHQDYDGHATALFGPMWEYADRRKFNYVFATRELLNLLYTLKEQGLIRGIQAEFGCSPWPATNIWFENPVNDSVPDEARYGLTKRFWVDTYRPAFEAIRAVQDNYSHQKSEITRLLVDHYFIVHQLASELVDHPVTAEMELRAFNNEKDVLCDAPGSILHPSSIGFRMGAEPGIISRLRQLNELSLESARRRAIEAQGITLGPGIPFINGAILSSLFNYLPWKAFLRKLDEYLMPGGLLIVYNAQEGERAHLDWKNIVEDQETIAAFIHQDLRYELRVYKLKKDVGPITPLYLVAQKNAQTHS